MAETANAGFAAGIGQRSRVTQLAWALKGAKPRKKDLRLTPLGAISELRKLRDRVSELMRDAGADPEDAIVLCAFAEPDLSRLVPALARLPVIANATELSLIVQAAGKLPIGFLIFVVDRNAPQRPIFGHARPLIVEDPRAIQFCQRALESYANNIKARLAATEQAQTQEN